MPIEPMGNERPSATPESPRTESSMAQKMPMAKGKMFLLGVASTALIVVVIGFGFAVQSIRNGSTQPAMLKLARTFGFAAVTVNGEEVSYADYTQQVTTLQKFYQDRPEVAAQLGTALTDEQVSDQVLSRLIINILVQEAADQYDVTVTDDELATAKTEIIAPFPTEADAEKQLQDAYGWSLDTYMDKVVRTGLLEKNLQTALIESKDPSLSEFLVDQARARHILFISPSAGDTDGAVEKEANRALARIKAGEDFTDVGTELSAPDADAEPGTETVIMEDLGWVDLGRTVPEFETALFALEPGKYTETLVKTTYGFHIIFLEEKRTVPNYEKFMEKKLRDADIKFHVNVHNPFEQFLNGTMGTPAVDDTSTTESGS